MALFYQVMKIILSRKGFDSSSGGMPSPIFPDGKIVSLPIPATKSPTRFKSFKAHNKRMAAIVSALSNGRIMGDQAIHLDPDIDAKALYQRPEGWRGAFGQLGAAQKHLENASVGVGDLFLFFGWFKAIEKYQGKWRFKPQAPDLHIIYGWMQVDKTLSVTGNEQQILQQYPWLKKHPHLYDMAKTNNHIYLATQQLSLFGPRQPGYGVFSNLEPQRILTDTQQKKRSFWQLPIAFYPHPGKPPLSYHHDLSRWQIIDKQSLNLQSVARGQEFVLDCDFYPEIQSWLKSLFLS